MEKRAIPLGVENFKRMIEENYYYVDKTLLIQELLKKKSVVSLFTRPRRFGKTLNMSMIRYYFELPVDGISNKHLFDGLKVMDCGEEVIGKQGHFPVISITFKSSKQPTFAMAYRSLQYDISNEFKRHRYILSNETLTPDQRMQFEAIMYRKAEDVDYATALRFLSQCLEQFHGRKVIILLDEYDVPLENAFFEGFYEPMIKFIRSLFESALKSNDSLEFAVITGCLRIGRESIFTGLNNLEVISIFDREFGEYFGFKEKEVRQLLKYYDREFKMETMKRWYDGYLFGEAEVYNPWSVIQFVNRLLPDPNAIPITEWANTSSNVIVRELVYHADSGVRSELQNLIDGSTIEKPIHEEITYEDIHESQDNLWNFLLFTGYLTVVTEKQLGDERYALMRIPNTEIRTIYNNQIRNWFRDEVKIKDLSALYAGMLEGKTELFEKELGTLLRQTISYMDGGESFYHGFLLGALANLQGYGIKSNREAGNGRFDIIVYNDDIETIPVIMELKVAKAFKDLSSAAERGLQQVLEKHYADIYAEDGYTRVRCYGIGFYKKQVRMKQMLVELENASLEAPDSQRIPTYKS